MSVGANIRAVLFDLDGTLLHTAPDLTIAVNQLRQSYSLPALPTDQAIAMVGRGAINLIRRALREVMEPNPKFDLDAAYAQFAKHYHAVNGDQTIEFDGVTDTLKALKAQGMRLAIVTNKPSEFSIPLVRQFGWDGLFEAVVCGDTTEYKKPHPEPMQHALTQLNTAPENALMVGDSMNDARAAVAVGCDCVILSYGYNEGTPMREALSQEGLSFAVYDHFNDALKQTLQQIPH